MPKTAAPLILFLAVQGAASADGATIAHHPIPPPEPALATEPPSDWPTRRSYAAAPPATTVRLAPLTPSETSATLEPPARNAPLTIGIGREIPAVRQGNLAQGVRWQPLPNGGATAAFAISSPGAKAVRLAFTATLPEGTSIRFFSPAQPGRAFPPLTSADLSQGRPARPGPTPHRWSPIIPGETVGIEVELAPGADPRAVDIRPIRLSHIHRTSDDAPVRTKTGHACETVHVACATVPDCPRDAVAKITLTTSAGHTQTCTATAVNSERSESVNASEPYILTADHCLSAQAEADTLEIDWHHQRSRCADAAISSRKTTTYGATLMHGDPSTDTALLRLHDPMPPGTCLAGWHAPDRVGAGTSVHGIHHPRGRPKSWAEGEMQREVAFPSQRALRVEAYEARWNEGVTEPGSSGSGLFTRHEESGADLLIGVLYGGTDDDCRLDYYGKLRTYLQNGGANYLADPNPPGPNPLTPSDLPPDDVGDSLADATGTLPNATVDAEIDHQADVDVFRVTLTESGTLTAYTASTLDTVGRLLGPTGDVRTEDDDSGAHLNFRLSAALHAGDYHIEVSSYDLSADPTGPYTLHTTFTAGTGPTIRIPLFLAASERNRNGRESFLRITNPKNSPTEATILAIDDSGQSAADANERKATLTLPLEPLATRGFTSADFEAVNPNKGLKANVDAISPGTGHWRLAVTAPAEISARAFIRTSDGFLTAMEDEVARSSHADGYRVTVFNPASNQRQRSLLRLANNTDLPLIATIEGLDDAGQTGQSTVTLTIAARHVRTLTAQELEAGAKDATGALGNGQGKWRLLVKAEGPIAIMNLLESPTGTLTSLAAQQRSNR